MKRILITITVLLSLHVWAQEEENPLADIAWTEGGSIGKIGSIAEIDVPQGYRFTERKGTQKILELLENVISGNELGLLVPDDLGWFVVFSFNGIGYVPDNEKDSLDADAILKLLKEEQEQSNKIRVKNGWAEMTLLGWEHEPHYDEATHNLEWATRVSSDGMVSVNYNTRLLGRKGVMSATLVCDPSQLESSLVNFKELLKGYRYTSGNRYAEYRKGDKIAEYGLTALIAGGATAVAMKSGAFKWIWKMLAIAGAAIAGFFKKLFGKKRDTANVQDQNEDAP